VVIYTSASGLLKFLDKKESGNVYVCEWLIDVAVPGQEREW
jgi:hypothetical protein